MNIKNKLKIEKLDDLGRGISYLNNKIIFIPNTLPNEEVIIEITKETTKYYEGKVIEYIKISKERIKPICPYYNNCGGCNLLHLNYENTIKYKENKLKNILKKFSNIDVNINVIKNKNTFYYRNKIELKIQDYKWGYYNSSSYNFIEIDKCYIAKESINEVINNKELFKIKEGNITIRSNYKNEILIIINTDNKINIDIDNLINKINLVGIVYNNKTIYGKNYFFELIKDKIFKVNYNSFFQINEYMTEQMIKILKENNNGEKILDLYCGVGVLGQSIYKENNKLYGIEVNENSIIDAKYNANKNNINNSIYLCGNTTKCINKINEKFDTLIIDPPRSGLFKNMINEVLNIKAKNIIYISCDPISLSRDLNKLKEYYKIEKIYLLDMFSYTYHLESIVILTKM